MRWLKYQKAQNQEIMYHTVNSIQLNNKTCPYEPYPLGKNDAIEKVPTSSKQNFL